MRNSPYGVMHVFSNILYGLNKVHSFFIYSAFISNARLKLEKNQANAKQHLEAELLLFEIIHILHSRYHLKIVGHILKNKYFCIHDIIRLIIMKMKIKMKNKSHRYDTNIVNIKYLSRMMLTCTKQHLSNI